MKQQSSISSPEQADHAFLGILFTVLQFLNCSKLDRLASCTNPFHPAKIDLIVGNDFLSLDNHRAFPLQNFGHVRLAFKQLNQGRF